MLPDWPADAPTTQLGHNYQNFRELVGEFFIAAKKTRADQTLSEIGKHGIVNELAESFKEEQLEAARARVAAAREELKVRGAQLDAKHKPIDEARARENRAAWREHVAARGLTLANLDLLEAIERGDDNELLAAIVDAPRIVRASLASDAAVEAARRALWESDGSGATAARIAEYDVVAAGVEVFDAAIESADAFADEIKAANASEFDEIVAAVDRSAVAKQTVAELLNRRSTGAAGDDAPGVAHARAAADRYHKEQSGQAPADDAAHDAVAECLSVRQA
jgi:hypothetical protein